MSKDYYKTIGVDKNATQDEIKKAFRKKAHKLHPDKEHGDEAKFKEVNEAYQVIGDEKKRQQYDQYGSEFSQQGGFGGGAGHGPHFDFGGVDLGDIFGDMFGGGGRRQQQRTRRGNDVQVELTLTFAEMVTGLEKDISVNKVHDCGVCDGAGAAKGSKLKTCSTCNGQGMVMRVQQTLLGAMQTQATCPDCSGRGEIPESKCSNCSGTGIEHGNMTYTVKIPAGIDTGQSIRLSGKGESGGPGGVSGDLYVSVRVKGDKRFVRDGNDVHTELTVSYPEAVLGATLEIDTVDGSKQMVVPAGTASHQKIRLKGLGIPNVNGGRRGDQYVKVIVDIPKKPNKKLKKLLEELKEAL